MILLVRERMERWFFLGRGSLAVVVPANGQVGCARGCWVVAVDCTNRRGGSNTG